MDCLFVEWPNEVNKFGFIYSKDFRMEIALRSLVKELLDINRSSNKLSRPVSRNNF